jgi:predicted phosphoadenosine phosphosulfate sulfurtransferase
MTRKVFTDVSVLAAAKDRVAKIVADFERVYISFSGGKDSSVMMHLVCQEARRQGKKIGVLIIDLEAQYRDTIKHIEQMVDMYEDVIDLHWVCPELLLRNAVSNYQPRWVCWESGKENEWVRDKPRKEADLSQYDFYQPRLEFEEFIVLWGEWYSQGKLTAACIGIRADESLHRYRAIVSKKDGLMFKDRKWTTMIARNLYNCYPIYDWRTEDIWVFHGKHKDLPHNRIYDQMTKAGVKLSQQRLCQPYGDDQRRGLWLYQILEPDTWAKLVTRVSGANSGAMYVQENGNVSGYGKISKPDGYTWKGFCNMLLRTMPKHIRDHYRARFVKFISGWKARGYTEIPDEAPRELEAKCWAPSWRRMTHCILRNDYWCKGLGQTQPKSEAYQKFKSIKAKRRMEAELKKSVADQRQSVMELESDCVALCHACHMRVHSVLPDSFDLLDDGNVRQ